MYIVLYRFIPNVYMPFLIQSNNNQGFPVILTYYFINAIVWISDFKPLHLEGGVDVHKYYCTWNSTTWKFCNPSYIICTLNIWEFMRNMIPHLRVTSVDPKLPTIETSTYCQGRVHWCSTWVAQLACPPRVDIWDLYPLSRQSVRRLSSTFSGYKSWVKRWRDYQIPYTTQQD